MDLEKIENLVRKGKKNEAFKYIKKASKNDRDFYAKTLLNEGINLGLMADYEISIIYFDFSKKIAIDEKLKEESKKSMAISYSN
ncbi:MAG: hypothetical protein ACE5K0_11010 [Candidatus Methanofastidiosia archaeon]